MKLYAQLERVVKLCTHDCSESPKRTLAYFDTIHLYSSDSVTSQFSHTHMSRMSSERVTRMPASSLMQNVFCAQLYVENERVSPHGLSLTYTILMIGGSPSLMVSLMLLKPLMRIISPSTS